MAAREHNPNIALLTAYKLKLKWVAEIRLITIINDESEKQKATAFLREFIELASLPIHETLVKYGQFYEELANAPLGDINIFGISPELGMEGLYKNDADCEHDLFVCDGFGAL